MRSKSALAFYGAALVLVPLGMGACDLIIGLNRYCGSDCDAAAVTDASDAEVDAPIDAGPDSVDLPDVVDEATSWPLWRIDNALPEVEAGAAFSSLRGFNPVGDAGTVIQDAVTGLVWSLDVAQKDTIEDAATYCAGLQPSGFRLPTRIELVTLLDTTQGKSPFIAAPFQQPITSAGFATGSIRTSSYARPVTQPIRYWFAQLNTGEVFTSTDSQAGVVCVR